MADLDDQKTIDDQKIEKKVNQTPLNFASSVKKERAKNKDASDSFRDESSGFDRAYNEYYRGEKEKAAQLKASKFSLPYINLMGYNVASSTLTLIPENVAEEYGVVAFLKSGEDVGVALVNPEDTNLMQYIESILAPNGFKPHFSVCSEGSIKYILKGYEHAGKVSENLNLAISKEKSAEFAKEINTLEGLKTAISKVPTTKVFDIIVSGAMQNRASDIHIEATKDGLRLRYRIDGVLQDVSKLNQQAYKSIIGRIKYLAGMKLDIASKAQDGRFTITVGDVPVDLRVSTLPTVWGESVVLRILSHDYNFLNLKKLYFSDHIQKAVETAIKKPTGLILNTGPTGSGKTTTLYAILAELNKPDIKIITLEDPVEYRIPGITQTQVDPDKGMDFANILKHTLRQDPDVILVGEIRDGETASTAIDAGLTGHLVLSTLHTNDASSAITRLLDMGVRPFLLPGVIRLVIAQRLVRKLCDSCRKEINPSPELVEEITKKLQPFDQYKDKLSGNIKLYQPGTCQKCNGTGYNGRIPIAECIVPSKKVEDLIMKQSPTSIIEEQVLKEGMIPMEADGLVKALSGLTTVEEVWRVTREI